MSTALKIFIFSALLILNVFANSNQGSKKDLIAAEKLELSNLAKRTDLTVKDWLQFVESIDDKCTNEPDTDRLAALCSFYYEMFTFEKLFRENPTGPTWEQCASAGMTSDSLAVNDSVKANVNRIANKLCPKP